MEKVSFVIPCYCSGSALKSVIDEIFETMEAEIQYEFEIILINDCSPDNTFDMIRSLVFQNENIIGINLAKNFGQHAALMAGFRHATGDIIVCLDDDGQTPASEVGLLLRKLEEGYDVAYASYAEKNILFFEIGGVGLIVK